MLAFGALDFLAFLRGRHLPLFQKIPALLVTQFDSYFLGAQGNRFTEKIARYLKF